jgi:hypothetical protein
MNKELSNRFQSRRFYKSLIFYDSIQPLIRIKNRPTYVSSTLFFNNLYKYYVNKIVDYN